MHATPTYRLHILAPLVVLAGAALVSGCDGSAVDADAGDAARTAEVRDGGDGGPLGACTSDEACRDGFFCTGDEVCDPGAAGADEEGCVAGTPPCSGADICHEDLAACLPEGCDDPDADFDGHRSIACGGDDCDDADPLRFAGAIEVCDAEGRDEDCNADTFGFLDADGDGSASAACCNGVLCGPDCHDADSTVHPRAGDGPPLSCDGVDNDCSGTADEGCPCVEGDTQRCGTPAQLSELGLCRAGTQVCSGGMFTAECIGGVSPQAEVCDEQDNDCDGDVDDGTLRTYVQDADGDGFGAIGGAVVMACSPPPGFAIADTDCDDGTRGVNPLAAEACNAVDDDCDGQIDEGVTSIFYRDADGDSFGALGVSTEACLRPDGYVTSSIDCDDAAQTINPAAPEACDGVDNNCNATVDEGNCMCTDGSTRECGTTDGAGGFLAAGECEVGSQRCTGGAWGTCSGATAPRAEICNTLDDDCDGDTDESVQNTYFGDGDGDGFGDLAVSQSACSPPPGFVGNAADCDDASASIAPTATETCDGTDNNCDGVTDPGCACLDGMTRPCGGADGMGAAVGECVPGSQSCFGGGWTGCAGTITPRVEACNQLDDDCDGNADEALTVDCWADPDDDGYAVTGAQMDTFCPVAGRAAEGGCPIFWTFRTPGTDDCADDDPNRFPGQVELCNDIDDDCDGTTDEGTNALCTAANGYGACLVGQCALVGCRPGFGDCNGALADGCEVDVTTDSAHCSGCGRTCGGGECSDQLCELPVALGGGSSHGCVRFASGRAACWGWNTFASLGDGTRLDRAFPAAVVSLNDAASMQAGGGSHSCVVRTNGTVACWGSNSFGGLGDGTRTQREVPTAVPGLSSVVEVAMGSFHSCARLTTGTLRCWGRNHLGQVGDGTSGNDRLSPVSVPGVSGVNDLALGHSHTCARTGATIRCWGQGDSGQLGDGAGATRATPVTVAGITNASRDLAAGTGHTCAIRGAGTISCWGSGGFGRLGDGTGASSNVPVSVVGISTAVQLAAGQAHTCARLATGTVRCWGWNDDGQLGDGSNTNRNSPVAVPGLTNVVDLMAGSNHTCALRSNGEVRCWGSNHLGQLGDGSTSDRNVPTRISSFGGVVEMSGEGDSTCARRSTGELLCWGRNDDRQIGDGTTTDRDQPVPVLGAQDYVDVTVGVLQLSDGNGHACGVRHDGTVACWGDNQWGQLGDGTTTNRPSPVAVSGLTDAVQIDAGSINTCVTRANGQASCWGIGTGMGSPGGTSSTPRTVSTLNDVVTVQVGHTFACALRQSGQVWCWGSNDTGQLGTGTTGSSSTPTPVSGLDDAIDLTVGDEHACALLADRTVVCWGHNGSGQLGEGTSTPRFVPTRVIALEQVVQVVAGEDHTCARRVTGELFCWGNNADSQLGDGTTSNRPAPVSVDSVGFVTSFAPGGHHTCVQISSGTVGCFGDNEYGQIGDGTLVDRPSFTPVSGL